MTYAKYSGFGGGGGGSSYTFADSIVNTGGTVTLVNDSATPGNSKYYGTDSGGTLGYFSLAVTATGNLTDVGTDGITITGGTGAVVGSGTSIAQHVADSTHNGYLSSTDWSTFNSKQTAGNYITALTGDGTASGPGSAALTLATVNANVGTFVSTTINAKGLVTAAANMSGDVTTSGSVATLATVNSNVGSFTYASITVNAKGLITAASSGAAPTGTVTSVGLSVPGTSIFGVTGSPVTTSGTLGLTTTGTSGGIPYFSTTTQLATSALLTANALVVGGGAGTAPSALGSSGTTTTVLHGNASGAPTFGAVSLTADVSGILPVANATIATQAIGTVTTAATVTWSNGNLFTMTLTSGSTCTVTFSGATSGQTIVIEATNGSAGGTGVITWPTVKWAGGTPPTMTVGTAAIDVYTFIYNGSYYVGSYVQNLS